MSKLWTRLDVDPRVAALLVSLGALALTGCKQDLGQRCEQGSDCSSGYCGDSTGGMVSAMGKTCTEPPTAIAVIDAGTPLDAATTSDAGDASSDALETGDAAGSETGLTSDASAAETGDAADAGSSDAVLEALPLDGAVDTGAAETSAD